MKQIVLAFILVAGIGLIAACSKSNSGPAKVITTTISGVPFNPASVTGADSSTLLVITGTTGTGSTKNTLTLMLENYNNTTGTYPIDIASSNTYASLSYKNGGTLYVATAGSVIVTAITTGSITGTFAATLVSNVTGLDTMQVTDGKFTYYR